MPEMLGSLMQSIVAFLREAGLETRIGRRLHQAVMPGVWIDAGVLVVSEDAPSWAVLHEAAHLALMPPWARELVRPGDAFASTISTRGRVIADDDPCRDDAVCLLWSRAVGRVLGLPPAHSDPPRAAPRAVDALWRALAELPPGLRPSIAGTSCIRVAHADIMPLEGDARV